MGKSTISMAIFNSYFDITRGYEEKWRLKPLSRTEDRLTDSEDWKILWSLKVTWDVWICATKPKNLQKTCKISNMKTNKRMFKVQKIRQDHRRPWKSRTWPMGNKMVKLVTSRAFAHRNLSPHQAPGTCLAPKWCPKMDKACISSWKWSIIIPSSHHPIIPS